MYGTITGKMRKDNRKISPYETSNYSVVPSVFLNSHRGCRVKYPSLRDGDSFIPFVTTSFSVRCL